MTSPLQKKKKILYRNHICSVLNCVLKVNDYCLEYLVYIYIHGMIMQLISYYYYGFQLANKIIGSTLRFETMTSNLPG